MKIENKDTKFEAIMASVPKVSEPAEGELRGGFISISGISAQATNLNCPAANYTGCFSSNEKTYFNINCPQAAFAACDGSANGTNENCGIATYCGNTPPPTPATDPTPVSSTGISLSMSMLW